MGHFVSVLKIFKHKITRTKRGNLVQLRGLISSSYSMYLKCIKRSDFKEIILNVSKNSHFMILHSK
jgi:hypothetical protein